MNVGQGDSVLIINRDLPAVQTAITNAKGASSVPKDSIDWVPYAVANSIGLLGTVKQALLVDAGDDIFGGDVVAIMTTYGAIDPNAKFQKNLTILVSHYHDDHMAGLRHMFKKRQDVPAPKQKGKKGKKAKPKTEIVDWTRPAVVYQSLTDKKTNPKSERFTLFSKDVEDAAAMATDPTSQQFIYPGGRNQDNTQTIVISLGKGASNIPINVHVLASGQAVWNAAKGQVVKIDSLTKVADQNDRSIVLMLEYGSFRYFLGGDIAGNGLEDGGNYGANAMDATLKRGFSKHADVESVLGPALRAYFPQTKKAIQGQPKFPHPGYCTVVKANHHASSSSVDVHLLSTLRPLLLVISSGCKARFHEHPTQEVLNRADSGQTPDWELDPEGKKKKQVTPNTIEQIYITEVADKVNNTKFKEDIYTSRIMGDVVVRPLDDSVIAVQQATTLGKTNLQVQVYGSGEQGFMLDPDTTLRPTEKKNKAGSTYPVGPFIHSDLH